MPFGALLKQTEIMTKNEFIQEMVSKGWKHNSYSNQFDSSYLMNGMAGYQFFADGRVYYSDPRGASQYKSWDDFQKGIKSGYRESSCD
jgi:hypothetical protein